MSLGTTRTKSHLMWVLLLVSIFMISGCTALTSKKAPTTSGSGSTTPKKKSIYLDFGDVLLPVQLNVDRNKSFVFSTSGFTAGLLTLKGRVDANSLISFFETKMPIDGWQMISAIKASQSMLLFKKQTRWCVISVIDGQLTTRVEIWVAPTMVEETGLLKPTQ